MNRKSFDLLVGLFVLLGFAALVFLAVRAGNMSSSLSLSGGGQALAVPEVGRPQLVPRPLLGYRRRRHQARPRRAHQRQEPAPVLGEGLL